MNTTSSKFLVHAFNRHSELWKLLVSNQKLQGHPWYYRKCKSRGFWAPSLISLTGQNLHQNSHTSGKLYIYMLCTNTKFCKTLYLFTNLRGNMLTMYTENPMIALKQHINLYGETKYKIFCIFTYGQTLRKTTPQVWSVAYWASKVKTVASKASDYI